MKKLIMVNGTMGIGKTSVCNELLSLMEPSVFLDGDWCWNMNPFVVTDETKRVVMSNITHMLRNYLNCSEYENVIFCWVMHHESIIQEVLDALEDSDFILYKFTLVSREDALVDRLRNDVENKVRPIEIIERSIQKSKYYEDMSTVKLDVSDISANEAARFIKEYVRRVDER